MGKLAIAVLLAMTISASAQSKQKLQELITELTLENRKLRAENDKLASDGKAKEDALDYCYEKFGPTGKEKR